MLSILAKAVLLNVANLVGFPHHLISVRWLCYSCRLHVTLCPTSHFWCFLVWSSRSKTWYTWWGGGKCTPSPCSCICPESINQLNSTRLKSINSNQSIPINQFKSVISQALWNNFATCWTNLSFYQSAYPPADLPLSISLSSVVLLIYICIILPSLFFSVLHYFFFAVFLHISISLFLSSCHLSSRPSINLSISI